MASSLPPRPSLDALRSQARRLQRRCRSGDPDAQALLAVHHPAPTRAAQQGFPLHAAQLAVARGYGFRGWPDLVGYLEATRVLAVRVPDDAEVVGTADRFCLLGCLRYDQHDSSTRPADALRLLAAEPELVHRSVWAAAAAADVGALQRRLADGPGWAVAVGGPLRRTALEYLCYARTGSGDALAAARLLLEAGADPNAGVLLDGLAPPFTALTGVFGEGEMGPARQPPHPAEVQLATLLLDAGADPNDAQTLYNRMFRRDDAHLRLLFYRGLGRGDGGPWQRRLGAATESVAEMMARQVEWARQHGMTERTALLAEHGWPAADGGAGSLGGDVGDDRGGEKDGASATRTRVDGPPGDGQPNGDRASGQRPGGGRPGGERPGGERQDDGPTVGDRPDGDRSYPAHPGRTALHEAAWMGELELVRELLASGADPDAVDAEWGTTPLVWAEVAEQWATADLLRQHTGLGTRSSTAPESGADDQPDPATRPLRG